MVTNIISVCKNTLALNEQVRGCKMQHFRSGLLIVSDGAVPTSPVEYLRPTRIQATGGSCTYCLVDIHLYSVKRKYPLIIVLYKSFFSYFIMYLAK